MKIRVLVEQRASGDRPYRASGEVVDVPVEEAKALLSIGEAEAVAEKPAQRAEKRPAQRKSEKRG